MADRLLRGASIRNTNPPFLWNDPVVLFNTANHNGVSSVLENEGTLGGPAWNIPIGGSGGTYWAIKEFNWYSRPNSGSAWPTNWATLIDGPPTDGPVVYINISGPNFDNSGYTEVEFLCDYETTSGLEHDVYFFPTFGYFEIDPLAFSGELGNLFSVSRFEDVETTTINYNSMMWGSAFDVSNRHQKMWHYDPTNGLHSQEYIFTSDGFVELPAAGSGNYYIDMWDELDTYGPASTIETNRPDIERFFAYIGDNQGLPGTGTPWDGTYINGIWRPTAIPTDAQIMALYNYYLGLL